MQLSVLGLNWSTCTVQTDELHRKKKSEVLGENAETPLTVQSLYICVSIG